MGQTRNPAPLWCCRFNDIGVRPSKGNFFYNGGFTYDAAEKARRFAGENEQPFERHIKMMTMQRSWNIENLNFSQLLAGNVSEFLFVWSPLKINGGMGSRGNPVALY